MVLPSEIKPLVDVMSADSIDSQTISTSSRSPSLSWRAGRPSARRCGQRFGVAGPSMRWTVRPVSFESLRSPLSAVCGTLFRMWNADCHFASIR